MLVVSGELEDQGRPGFRRLVIGSFYLNEQSLWIGVWCMKGSPKSFKEKQR